MTDSNKIKKLDFKEWLDIGTKLYGYDKKNWKFVCPMCKKVQTGQDFLDLGFERDKATLYIGFSCIGRFHLGKSYLNSLKNEKFPDGCDWTLGGLFGGAGHEVIIIENGQEFRRFDFADSVNKHIKGVVE